jgi:hypothetical protein
MAESFWQEKMAVHGDIPILVPICPSQTPQGLVRYETQASAVTSK